jgi:hypothetical protein
MAVGPSANQFGTIDFGLVKRYCDGTTHAHIPRVEGKSLTGTAGYAVFFETLCRSFPREFVKYFIDVHSLQFTDETVIPNSGACFVACSSRGAFSTTGESRRRDPPSRI